MPLRRLFLSLIVFCITAPHASSGQTASEGTGGTLDTLIFGDAASEKAHALVPSRSDVIEGRLGQTARRLLPLDRPAFEGGTITFDVKVNPAAQNYFTIKLWGSDCGAKSGRLILLSGHKQIGYRHEGDYDVLNQIEDDPSYPGRFVYMTAPLPPMLTKGQRRLSLTMASLGPMWPYGTTFEQYQKGLTQPTRGIYRAYTHTDSRFVPPADEKQGEPPPGKVRPAPGEEVIQRIREHVNDQLKSLADGTVSDFGDPLSVQRSRNIAILLLVEAYTTPWTVTFHDDSVVQRIIREGDAFVRSQARDGKFLTRDWQGAGPLGEAVTKLHPQLGRSMDELIDDGHGRQIARKKAWAKLLLASRDYWRIHRRFYTNQSMIVDRNIYTANRGVRLLDPASALPEPQAMRYLYEACGIEPWLGSDTSDGHGERPYGGEYRTVTRKGLTRELGYVGTYGETIFRFTLEMAQLTGDAKIREQVRKLQLARLYFRYPSVNADGYRAMRLESTIDNRTAHYPGGLAYAAADVHENWGMELAASFKDDPAIVARRSNAWKTTSISRLQRRMNENDLVGLMRSVDDYGVVKPLPRSERRLPMADGQGDFAWADEEDAVLALHHGDCRLFVNFYYRSEHGINGVARIHELEPRIECVSTVRTQFEYIPSGREFTRPDWIDGIRTHGLPPPGSKLSQAWAGEKLPIAARPADAKLPRYGDWGPFVGKASFYRLHYGDYLIGMNCDETRSYDLAIPPGHTEALDLITGKTVALARTMKVPPLTTIVLLLGE